MDHNELYRKVRAILPDPEQYGYLIRRVTDGSPTPVGISLIPNSNGTVIATTGDNRTKVTPVLNSDGSRRIFEDEPSACEWAWQRIQLERVPPPTYSAERMAEMIANGRDQIERLAQLERETREHNGTGASPDGNPEEPTRPSL